MPIFIIALGCLLIFLVMGVLALSAVRKELRTQREQQEEKKLAATQQQ